MGSEYFSFIDFEDPLYFLVQKLLNLAHLGLGLLESPVTPTKMAGIFFIFLFWNNFSNKFGFTGAIAVVQTLL